MRDYTDFMNMTANDLAQYAREHADGNDLVNALADLLDAVVKECNQLEDCNGDLRVQVQELEYSRDEWQEECRALQRQMDRTYG